MNADETVGRRANVVGQGLKPKQAPPGRSGVRTWACLLPVALALTVASNPVAAETWRLGPHLRHDKPDSSSVTSSTAEIMIEGDSATMSVKLFKVPFRKMLSILAEEADIKVFVAHSVPEDAVSDAFQKVPLETAIRRLLAGKGYALRYAPAATDAAKRRAGDTQHIAEMLVVPDGSGLTSPDRMEEVGQSKGEAAPSADPHLEKALQVRSGRERAAALKEYLETGEPDYAAVAEALKDADPKVRTAALNGMEDSDTLPVEATAEAALTDKDPALRINALRVLVERTGGAAGPTVERALADPDPRVRAHAQDMASVAKAVDAFDAKRGTE